MNISLRILHRPEPSKLSNIYLNIGTDYAERVLPSIVNEVLKAIVVSSSIQMKKNAFDMFIHFLSYYEYVKHSRAKIMSISVVFVNVFLQVNFPFSLVFNSDV